MFRYITLITMVLTITISSQVLARGIEKFDVDANGRLDFRELLTYFLTEDGDVAKLRKSHPEAEVQKLAEDLATDFATYLDGGIRVTEAEARLRDFKAERAEVDVPTRIGWSTFHVARDVT